MKPRLAIAGLASTWILVARAMAASWPADPHGDAPLARVRVEPGTTFEQIAALHTAAYGAIDLDPGVPVEGDDIGRVAFTPDGTRVFATSMGTGVVTVFDAATRAVLANLPVGTFAYGIAMTSTYVVIACPFGNAVWIVRLSDLGVAKVVPTGEQPWIVRTSPDGRYAWVSTDVANTCERIDLVKLRRDLVISDFPVGITSYSFNSENGRIWVDLTDFEITPDGSRLVVGDGTDAIRFYDTATGGLAAQATGVGRVFRVEFSGNGQRIAALESATPLRVHQVDVATQTRTATVTFPGLQSGATWDVAVNADGSKVYASVDGNLSVLARFATNSFVAFGNTGSAFWVGTSPDHSLALSGQYRFSIVDFATETVLGQWIGDPQWSGAVSPVGTRAAAFDPHRHEGIYFYDYAAAGALTGLGTTNVGEAPEGDCPRRVAIAPDGGKAVVTNVLSDNATILNLGTLEVEAIVPIGDRVQDVAITPDSRWAAVCGFDSNALAIVDLAANAVVANVPCGVRPGVVTITPDGQYAYVGDISSNTVSVVRLAGAASLRIAQVPCGEIGTLFAASGISSAVRASPNGSAVLVAASFDDQVMVVSTATHSVVATLPVGDFPLQIDFDASGSFATVTNTFSSTVSVVQVAGAASTVVGDFPRGPGPMRLAYDAVHDRMGIGNYDDASVAYLDPRTGALLGTESWAGWGNVVQVDFDATGSPLVLTLSGAVPPAHFHRGSEHIALPAAASCFDYDAVTQTAVVVTPGPDHAVVLRFDPTGTEIISVPLESPGRLAAIEPNPLGAGSRGRVRFDLTRAADVELVLVDAAGRRAATLVTGRAALGRNEAPFRVRGLAAGTYFARLRVDGRAGGARKVTILER